jgi:hypothetical protein
VQSERWRRIEEALDRLLVAEAVEFAQQRRR